MVYLRTLGEVIFLLAGFPLIFFLWPILLHFLRKISLPIGKAIPQGFCRQLLFSNLLFLVSFIGLGLFSLFIVDLWLPEIDPLWPILGVLIISILIATLVVKKLYHLSVKGFLLRIVFLISFLLLTFFLWISLWDYLTRLFWPRPSMPIIQP